MDTRDELALSYLENWRDHDHYSFLNVLLDRKHLKLAAKLLVDTSLIDSTKCEQPFKPLEEYLESLVRGYGHLAWFTELDELMLTIEIWTNADGRVAFVDRTFHFISHHHLKLNGFKRTK